MGTSTGFEKLHKDVQRWIWDQKWTELRDIQEQAIDPILCTATDLIISASTASGKTEAAFLPSISKAIENDNTGISILYISPLKALINDQFRRLLSLSDRTDIPVTPWHGDISLSKKNKQLKKPNGILLITPESLESLLLKRMPWCKHAFINLLYIIIDEFHSFIGTERGKQLQSLLHRLEFLLKQKIPRIALSATLGDMQLVADNLRPQKDYPCKIIESTLSHSDLKIQLRGYLNIDNTDDEPIVFDNINQDLYKYLRKTSNLVFANSRQRTESIASSLSDLCEHDNVPNEFFPHHGNLSKELREHLEQRLQKKKVPTTAVCTSTLELGIDIGNVDSIAQVTSPHSVAGLRQRLGRSGRRNNAAILRMFIPEMELKQNSHIADRLRLSTFQSIAMVNLLLKKWYEPPIKDHFHFSTLIQQTLSIIGQYGGVQASQLWKLLCQTGPFDLVSQDLFVKLLRCLGEYEIITQLRDGQITLGVKGEKVVEHYTFYSAFITPEEYRLEFNGKVIGTVPMDKPLMENQHIVFAGKRWEVLAIYPNDKLIKLEIAKGGKPPNFEGERAWIHDIVRKEMFNIYSSDDIPIYLDEQAKLNFQEGKKNFNDLELNKKNFIQVGSNVHIIPWYGDEICLTITMLLLNEGLRADCYAGIIDVRNSNLSHVKKTINEMLKKEIPTVSELASVLLNTKTEKHDIYLSRELSDIAYGAKYFNIEGAINCLKTL